MLPQSIEEALEASSSLLLCGAGGGYDVVGAVPLLAEIHRRGRRGYLASLTFTSDETLAGTEAVESVPGLYRVKGENAKTSVYFPEAWLAAWLAEAKLAEPQVWCFRKSGVQPLRAAYQHLVDHLGIDAILLVDGGIDGLLRGDETSLGTPGEDLASIAAVSSIPDVRSWLACIGFGAELRDGISHAQALESMARLTKRGGYLGCASLLLDTPAGQSYLAALDFIFEHQATVRRSHVQSVIRAAVAGEFGSPRPATWISPLASVFWFFSLPAVAENHLFLDALKETTTIGEVNRIIEGVRKGMTVAKAQDIPL